MQYADDQNTFGESAIKEDVLAFRDAAKARREFFTGASHTGMLRKTLKLLMYGINETLGDLNAALPR